MKKVFVLIIAILLSAVCFSENDKTNNFSREFADSTGFKRNGIYAESYFIRHDFSSGWVSINYERVFGKKNNMRLRLGVYPDFISCVSFPITYTFLSPARGNHNFEYGIGLVFRIEHYVDPNGLTEREWFYDMPAVMIPLMYRYQSDFGWFIRGGVNVFVSWPTLPSPSLSVGFAF